MFSPEGRIALSLRQKASNGKIIECLWAYLKEDGRTFIWQEGAWKFFITARFAFFCMGVFCCFEGVLSMDFKVD